MCFLFFNLLWFSSFGKMSNSIQCSRPMARQMTKESATRRSFLSTVAPLVASVAGSSAASADSQDSSLSVEQWAQFEVSFDGPQSGNPFIEVQFSAEFRREHRVVHVDGFYDGDGKYRVRFMPDMIGDWSFRTHSNQPQLHGKTGDFRCRPPRAGNHGPITVSKTWHFSYADRTPYAPFGTTCYAWTHQSEELQRQTLSTLGHAPFNKIRMCVFPKWYEYNRSEPLFYPFPRTAAGQNDFGHFNPQFFQHLEQRVNDLLRLGIQADLILFHPYDHWGYSNMPPEVDDRYLRYVVARLASFRNVWWAMANEWDFVKTKTLSDWNRFFRIVQESDPYQHLRSIHNGRIFYDHSKPWVTHASIQSDEFEKTADWLNSYLKPVVFDECKYEGNIPQRWGNLSAREMVRRFWLGTASGGYVGHGETYLNPQEILWWSKGGVLHGDSAPRIAFLRKLVEENWPDGLNPLPNAYYPGAGKPGESYLYYFDYHQPAEFNLELPGESSFEADLIDPWEMTKTRLPGRLQRKCVLKLPGQPYLAVHLKRAG